MRDEVNESLPQNRTLRMLKSAYPLGIPAEAYLPLLVLFDDAGMTQRGIAETISYISEHKYHEVLHDVAGVLGRYVAVNPEAIVRVREHLEKHGYDEWYAQVHLPEEPLPALPAEVPPKPEWDDTSIPEHLRRYWEPLLRALPEGPAFLDYLPIIRILLDAALPQGDIVQILSAFHLQRPREKIPADVDAMATGAISVAEENVTRVRAALAQAGADWL